MEKTKPIKNPPKSAKNPKIVVKTKPNQEKSTRFQESYFNPKLHKHNWEPSGKFKEKKKYTYSDAGLGFNIGEPKIINQNNANALIKKTPTHFLEFDFSSVSEFDEFCLRTLSISSINSLKSFSLFGLVD